MVARDHSALMDGVYRHQRHIYDLTRAWFLFGRDRLISDLDPPEGGRVLEIGCGTGRNLIKAARRYQGAEFFGVDISASMLRTAESAITKNGLESRISVARGDAASFDPEPLFRTGPFNCIFFSFSLSMIPVWEAAIARSLTLLGPNGKLMVVDFSGQQTWPRPARDAFQRFLAHHHVTPRLALRERLQSHATMSGQSVQHEVLYGDYAQLLTFRK